MKIRPGRTFPFVFPDQRDSEDPDIFQLRVLSVAASEDVASLVSELQGATKQKQMDNLKQCLQICVATSPIKEELTSILTTTECWELVNAAHSGSQLTADERKKFVSQPTLPESESATTALTAT